jgi:hypothetical protein
MRVEDSECSPYRNTMRLPVSLLALVTATGEITYQATKANQNNAAIDHYFDELIPVVNDTILYKNAGPGIGADVKTRPLYFVR